jgi:hypothetical protein
MSINLSGVELFGEVQERVFDSAASTKMSYAVLNHRVRLPLTEESDASWQIGTHPFVAASDDEVSEFQAVVKRDVAERLGSVDEAEP